VKAAEHPEIQQPRHNLFDILRLVVMAGVHQHLGLRASGTGEFERHPQSPISV